VFVPRVCRRSRNRCQFSDPPRKPRGAYKDTATASSHPESLRTGPVPAAHRAQELAYRLPLLDVFADRARVFPGCSPMWRIRKVLERFTGLLFMCLQLCVSGGKPLVFCRASA